MSPRPDLRSCIYYGRIVHRRVRPVEHCFAYNVFSILVDLDELEELDGSLALFASNRRGLVTFRDSDHGPRDGTTLRPWLETRAAEAGIDLSGGRILVHTFPRIAGYVFNPLTTWYCHSRDGSLAAILYEVSNTFGQSHSYLLPVEAGCREGELISQSCRKQFYVSPFIAMDMSYHFKTMVPTSRLSISIRVADDDGPVLQASHVADRKALDKWAMLTALKKHPFMATKIMSGIYREAFTLWKRRLPRYRRPEAQPPAEQTDIDTDRIPASK